MDKQLQDVADFHRKFGIERQEDRVTTLNRQLAELRVRRLLDEAREYGEAVGFNVSYSVLPMLRPPMRSVSLRESLDALVDSIYIALGSAHLHGFDRLAPRSPFSILGVAWRRVHDANMKKERAGQADKSKFGSTFDIIKPEGWVAPDLTDLIPAEEDTCER